MIKIAIDGPGGAGKSTISRAVAAKLGIVYVDTGALYRSIGLYVRSQNIDPKNEAAVTACLPEIELRMTHEGGEQHIYLCGENVGDKIRTPEMSMYASAVSAIPAVRTFLLDTQRNIAATTDVIMDGRDIGTVILPNADVKFYLNADPEIRAMRRYRELREKGQEVNEADILREIQERDYRDEHREVAPAVAAPDTVHLNGNQELPDTLADALAIIRERIGD